MIMFRDMVESVIDEKDEVRDIAGGCRWRLRLCGLLREPPCVLDTMLLESVILHSIGISIFLLY